MSTLMIPFNNQPVDTVQLNCSPNSTASYTIPSGKYARVSYFYGCDITNITFLILTLSQFFRFSSEQHRCLELHGAFFF